MLDWVWSIAALYVAGWPCGYVATSWRLAENEYRTAGMSEGEMALAAAAYTSVMWPPVLIQLVIRTVRHRQARRQ
jgi:hypothetical protein